MSTISRRHLILGAASTSLTSLATPALSQTATLARIQVRKSKRKLDLISAENRIIQSYDMRLGRVPVGAKRFHRDMRTPEGTYRINRKNPYSRFNLSLGLDYPRRRDRIYASQHGRSPGGDIFIHGQPNGYHGPTIAWDWTWGCIAVSNEDIQDLFRRIGTGTDIVIYA
jgi:murein L,D-transpeptidase YafK